ncbi:MAG: hypothetical protein OEY14_04380 [Myxococcales bacterium]|nr:hypothetical protein [Myxococcales bacterium]
MISKRLLPSPTLGLLSCLLPLAYAGASSAQAPAPIAAPPPGGHVFRFHWVRTEGAEGCAAGEALQEEVRQRLGRDPFRADAARSIEGIVSREGRRWTTRIYVRDAAGAPMGARTLQSSAPECAPLDEAAALAISLTIDPEAGLSAPTAAPPTPPAPVARAAPEEPPCAAGPSAPLQPAAPPPEPARAAASDRPSRLELGLSGALGLLPSPALGPAISGRVGLGGRIALRLALLHLPEVETRRGALAFGLSASGAGACVATRRGRWLSVDTCLMAWIGELHAVVRDPIPTDPGGRLWGALGLGALASIDLPGSLFVGVGLDLLLPLARYRFLVEGWSNPAFEAPALGLVAGLWLGLRR